MLAGCITRLDNRPPVEHYLQDQGRGGASGGAANGASSYSIKQQLREAGITESVIFPDLDGLGREMDQLWEDKT